MRWPFVGRKPYLCLKLKTVLSTQLEADISPHGQENLCFVPLDHCEPQILTANTHMHTYIHAHKFRIPLGQHTFSSESAQPRKGCFHMDTFPPGCLSDRGKWASAPTEYYRSAISCGAPSPTLRHHMMNRAEAWLVLVCVCVCHRNLTTFSVKADLSVSLRQ